LWQAVDGLHQIWFSVSGIVNDGIEITELVDLLGDGSRLRDARQVADDDVLSAGDLFPGLVRARGAAGVQHDLVSFFDQKLGVWIGVAFDPQSAPKVGSDSLLMQFEGCLAF
jgi:hypothetical protein